MTPNKILIMRHAEKPGVADDIHLAPAGVARAQQLVTYIPATFGNPQFLFAAKESKDSDRPVETIRPLSQPINVRIDSSFDDHQYNELGAEILNTGKYEGSLILVCWHHEKIPKLVYALGASRGMAPDPWDDNVFNLILVLDFGTNGPSVSEVVEPF